MTTDQGLLFLVFGAILGLLLWGRVRHDLVAAGGLLLCVVLGLVPEDEVFAGFSNPAVIIVALVLIASRAIENSGALSLLRERALHGDRSVSTHIMLTGGIGAALSAVINNVAALALLMPLDVQTARAAGRPPGVTLMPLSYATILGGMVTLIGTPPNIIASSLRERQLGEPYAMFDFAPVGLAVAIAGLLFIALIGWRLVPRHEDRAAHLARSASFRAELRVPEGSDAIGRLVADLDDDVEKADVILIGLVRERERYGLRARTLRLKADDILRVEGSTDAIARFIKALSLQEADDEADAEAGGGNGAAKEAARREGLAIVEAVVRSDSRLAWTTAATTDLRSRFKTTLLAIARAGRFFRGDLHNQEMAPGDTLLLTGPGATRLATREWLGLIAINEVSVAPSDARRMAIAIGLFAAAITVATLGLLSFHVAIALAVIGYAAFRLIPAREFYQQIDWPVIVMLACLLPIGASFDRVGGTALIANSILDLTAGQTAIVVLIVFMIAVMTLADVLNNVATMIIAGPLAIDVAQKLGVNPDTFLMGAAIATSCAFLTPIGHKNNTLIMGPGAFKFADYWRMGLPLEIVVLCVSVPALLFVWPLTS